MSEFQKLRLVHVTDGRCRADSLHGGDVSLFHFTKNLAAIGHEVRFVGVTEKEPSAIPGVDSVSASPGLFPLIASRSFKSALVDFRPDLVHFHGAYVPVNFAGARAIRDEGIPYVVTPHGNLSQDVLNRRGYLKKPYRKMFELPLLEDAMFVHAIADREVIREYGVTKPIEEARNGIDLPDDYHQSMSRDGITKYGVAPDRKVALYLGRLDVGQKGLDVLLEGFAIAKKSDPKLHLILAGVDWKGDREKLEKMVKDLSVENSVTFTGAVHGSDKEGLLRDCDFFVHPSCWEAGVPFSVLEAFSYGKTCVVTSEVDREDLIGDSPCTRLVEITKESVSEGIRSLSSFEKKEAEDLGRLARELCMKHFSWKASALKLTEAYLKHL